MGFFAAHHPALETRILADDALHFLTNALEILGRKGALHQEIVLKLFRVIGASGIHLGIGEESLDGVCHHVFRGMANHLAAFRVAGGDDLHRRISGQRCPQIDQLAVDAAGQSSLGQPRTNLLGHGQHRRPTFQVQTVAVGERHTERVTHGLDRSWVESLSSANEKPSVGAAPAASRYRALAGHCGRHGRI